MAMLRGCLFALTLYGGLSAAYYWWLSRELGSPENWIAALVAGFATFCCIGALLNSWYAARDRKLVRAAILDLPPVDGQLMAAVGTIHSMGDSVVAPFSERPCVLCEYSIETH
ncbi:MAG TPA: hypothetical protein VL096_00490, partial [Pirellulaceae bacterium]|nr:hypothetical protein [Pirellulaceae bacterium]